MKKNKVKSHVRKTKKGNKVVRSHFRKGKDGKKYDMRTHTMHGTELNKADREQLSEEFKSGNRSAFSHYMKVCRASKQ